MTRPAERTAVGVTEADLAREFMRRHLGDDWELQLIAADAAVDPETSLRDTVEQQMRAVDLVSEVCADRRPETRTRAAEAWHALWLDERRSIRRRERLRRDRWAI